GPAPLFVDSVVVGLPLSEGDGSCAADDFFYDLRGAYDRGTLQNLLFGDPARLCTRSAQPDMTAVLDELPVEIRENGKPRLCDAVGASCGSEPYRFDRTKHDGLLSRGGGYIRRNERQRRALGVLSPVRTVEDQLVTHLIVPFRHSPGGVRPTPRSNEQRDPSSEPAEASLPSPPDRSCSRRAGAQPVSPACDCGTVPPSRRRSRGRLHRTDARGWDHRRRSIESPSKAGRSLRCGHRRPH